MPSELEQIYRQAICCAEESKAAEPDRVPMEILKICPKAFAELLFELFAAGARLKCVMKDWDLSILIPIFKKKDWLPSQPTTDRSDLSSF